MCGRYTLTVSGRVLAELFELGATPEITPRYNIAPTQRVPVVRADPRTGREWAEVRWGLVPHWAKEASIGARMINARSETVAEKPAFRNAVRRRRCLIPADGFYEWQRVGQAKVPHYIHFRDHRPFAFAGLWERWQPAGEEPLETCAILTTRPNPVLEPIHDRMPVILPREQHQLWLGPGELSAEQLEQLLAPHPPDPMEAYAVSTRVNTPGHDDPGCVERAAAVPPP